MPNKPRVRFAPSPTGTLHIGSARTALYNWLYARANNGSFILRIEDTDISRSTEQALNSIIDDLKWLGLDWDEGPDAGGSHAPYRQTERFDVYNRYIDKLLAGGRAYHCYCTPEELQAEREEARKQKIPFRYSRRCKRLTQPEINKFERRGRVPSIKYSVPDEGHTSVNDLIRGIVTFQNENIGDFILVRRNKIPTYNLVVSVDDAEMDISHVIRGEDHLSNTPKQVLLLKDFSRKIPQYAHLPLIIGPDRQPLSKRHGATSVEEFRSQGYLPEALINYLALLGWSYDDKTTFFSKEELVNKFDVTRVSKSPATIDFLKLEWMNGHYIRNMPLDELASKLKEYLKFKGLQNTYLGDGKISLESSLSIVQEKIKTLAGFHSLNSFLYTGRTLNEDALKKLLDIKNVGIVLKKAGEALENTEPFVARQIETNLKNVLSDIDIKPKHLFQAVRIAVSGRTVTGGLFESLELLGKEKTLTLIRETIDILSQ